MILKHRDTEVLRFDWVQPFGVKNVEVNSSAEHLLPLAFRDRVRHDPSSLSFELETWMLTRTPPIRRAGIREMLRHLGFGSEDPAWMRNLITFSRALSLNDVHWIASDDSREKWADTNLYDNPFSTAVAAMAFTGDRHEAVRDASTSPEYSTDGNLRKCWRRLDGQVLLYKGSGSGGGFFDRNAVGFEPFAEYYSAQLAEAMGLAHVPYGLSRFKHTLCSTCPLFTSDKVGFVQARGLLSPAAVRQDPRFAEILFFDAIIFNTDRHTGNLGFLVDNDINEFSGIAPIFDNGYGLFSQAISSPGKRDDELSDLRRFLARKEPKLFDRWLDIPGGVTDALVARLRGLENFSFHPHPLYKMPDNRLEVSQYFIRNRIAKILQYREKADRFLRLDRKDDTIKPVIPAAVKTDVKPSTNISEDLKGMLKLFPKLNTAKLAECFNTTTRTIARHLKELQEAGELKRVGSRKTGSWEVLERKH